MNKIHYWRSVFYTMLLSLILSGCNGNKMEEHNHNIAEEHLLHNHHHSNEHNYSHQSNEQHKKHPHKTDIHTSSSSEIVIPINQAQAAGIQSETIFPSTFRHVLLVSGEIESAQGEEQVVVANVAGVVSFCRPLKEGMNINTNNILLTISSQNLQDGDPAEKARITYEAAQKEYERVIALAKDKIVAEKELNRIKEIYEKARIAYEALTVKKGIKGTSVTSPIDGHIKSCMVKEGDYVNIGEPLVKISRNRHIYLRADVPEKHYDILPRIVTANFKLAYSNRVYSLEELNGQLLSCGQTSGETPFYIPVTFSMNKHMGIIPGSYAEIYLLSDEKPNVLSLPHTALTEELGHYFAYIQLDDECYQRREIKIGNDNGQRVEILSGIAPGERIVTQGAYQVKLASVAKSIPGHSHEH